MSCWECDYQRIGGDTFLGICTYFSRERGKEDKEIPPHVVDAGCKLFKQKNAPQKPPRPV